MMALHPRQVPIFAAGLISRAGRIARVEAIAAAFAAKQGTGVPRLNGKIADRPHLVQVRRILTGASQ